MSDEVERIVTAIPGPRTAELTGSLRAYESRNPSGDPTAWDLPVFRTGDRELGPLWTITGGGGLYFYLGSSADPQKARLSLSVDGMYTSFLNDLYITSRSGLISSVTLEVEL